ncbi:MAG TPA: hypothetical protein VJ717_20185 [Gemmatimonadaceae bacterium]|nr:hypothetical protein [Gemmatimonadaceae bacterium]
MILANARQSLTRDDAQLALRLVARGSAQEYDNAEARLRDSGMDTLLDDPRLLAGLLTTPQGAHASLPLFAYVVVRHALRDAGADDRMIADYVTAMFMHFGLRDRAQRIGDADDEVYSTFVDLLADVGEGARSEEHGATRAFLVRTHLGNYALWLSGLFPDHIEHRRWRRGGPDLDYVEDMGRRGFTLAARHRLASTYGLEALFSTMAERFGVMRVALNRVSDRLLFPHVHSPERLMRQVRDARFAA